MDIGAFNCQNINPAEASISTSTVPYSQMSHNRKPLHFHWFHMKWAACPYSKAVHQPTFILVHFCLQVERKELRRNTYEILNKYISLIMP